MENSVESPPKDPRRWLYRAMIVLGPIGLFVVISLAMWVANWRVGPGISVQVEPTWRPGENLALRLQLLDGDNQKLKMESAKLFVRTRQSDPLSLLTDLRPVDSGRSVQGNFIVPLLPHGPLVVTAKVKTRESAVELQKFHVSIVDTKNKLPSSPLKYPSETALMRADDSDPQPEGLFFDIRPDGRFLAGLNNKLWLRISDRKGIPVQGEVTVVLIQGEFTPESSISADSKLLFQGPLDSMGLAEVRGKLLSEVIRLEVRFARTKSMDSNGASSGSQAEIIRKVRLVSRTGATKIHLSPKIQTKGHSFSIFAESLQAKSRPIYADLYDESGRWVNTLSPTLVSGGEKRNWYLPDELAARILRVEAYTTLRVRPEIVDVQYLWLRQDSEPSAIPLEEMIDYWSKNLDSQSASKDSKLSAEVDRNYLKHLRGQKLDSSKRQRLSDWLLGTLKMGVSIPPTLSGPIETAKRDLEQRKQSWMTGLRVALYGGGGLLIIALAIVNWMEARDLNRRTALVLGENSPSSGYHGTATLLRSLMLLAVMVLALILAGILLDSFVWGQSEIWR